MNSEQYRQRLVSLLVPICLIANPVQSDDLWDMSLEDAQSVRVTSIATGTETPLDKAAAVVSVITAEDIAEMGARDIEEVLETVPGLHVGRNPIVYTPKFNIRGITSYYAAQTLILINGVPISSLYLGTPSLVWAGMPVKAIKKIEVIRGPGSALYGADAFAGVINITTQNASDIPESEFGVGLGSFQTKNLWAKYGYRGEELDLSLVLEHNKTDGFDSLITSDAQSLFDSISGTNASNAPGPVNTGKELLDARFEVNGEWWTYRLAYQGRQELEAGAGISQALSPTGEFTSDRVNTDMTFTFKDLVDDLDLTSRLSYYYADQQVDKNNVLYPAGSNLFLPLVPPATPLYPDGAIGNPEYREEQARINIDGQFSGIDRHILRFGIGYFWGDIYEVTEQKNFLPNLTPRPNGLEDVSDTDEVFLPEEDRTSGSIYLQDEWLFADSWALTTGVRYDHFSTFGETTNPRAALVWAMTDRMTTKFLYGKAFRAPTIAELFVTSNPVNLGNPELDPERIDTYEIAFSHQPNDKLSYSTNLFLFEIDDYINFVPIGGVSFQAKNVGRIKGKGLEFEATYELLSNLDIQGNFAYHDTEDKNAKDDVGETPNKQFYIKSIWEMTEELQFNSQLNWVGKQDRAPSDNRGKVDDYTTVDLILRASSKEQPIAFSIAAKNIFDEEVFEASPPPSPPFTEPYIPNDFPMAGRSFYAELSYKL